MKVKMKKSLALILIVILTLSNSYITSAHTHVYTFSFRDTTYEASGSTSHRIKVITIYKCTCGDMQYTETDSTASHVFPAHSYSGYNYHSGTKHIFEFASYCNYCSYRDSYTTTRSCSGPPCTIPY